MRYLLPAALTVALMIGFAETEAAEDLPNRSIDPGAPMSFEYTGNGGNIKDSDWIAAEGTITTDTPNRFKELLGKAIARNTTVQFNSPGGNLIAAIKLGEMIRAARLDTSIGRTVLKKDGGMWSAMLPGLCASACAYAFLGGEMRIVGTNDRYGVHQFYDSASLDEPAKKAFSAIDMSLDHVLGGLVLEYVLRMGANARLVSLAEATPPWNMHYLTADELQTFLVDNTGSVDTEWRIEAREGGAVLTISSTYSTRPPLTLALLCRRGRAGVDLIVSSSTSYLDRWLSEGYAIPQPLSPQEVIRSLDGIDISGREWKQHLGVNVVARLDIDKDRRITVVANLGPESVKLIRGGGPLRIDFVFPWQFAGFLSADIRSYLRPEALDLALRNCVR